MAPAVFGDDYAAMTLSADEKGVSLLQVPIPFGADYGGVNKELFKVKSSSQFDTWITIGDDKGNPTNKIRCRTPPTPCSAPRSAEAASAG